MKNIENEPGAETPSIAVHQRGKERKYWLNKLAGEFVKTSFPFDYIFDYTGESKNKPVLESFAFELSGELYSRLMRLGNNSDIRLYIILMTGVVLLLEKYTGSRDITIGAPIYRQDMEGDFINKIVVLRNPLIDNMSFKELLLQASKTNLEAMENINYPLETISFDLNMSFPEDEFPLFDVAVLLENIHEKSYIDHISPGVIFRFSAKENSIEGLLEYNARAYSRKTIERITSHYIHLMQTALTDIDQKIADITMISEEEMRQIVVDFNTSRSRADYPREKTIHELFREQVERTPDNIAVIFKEDRLTYSRLNEKADRLAGLLRNSGVRTETLVAILLEHSFELVIAVLAVLKAGGAYLPIDPEYPVSRIDYLLEDSRSKLLIAGKYPVENIRFNGTLIRPENGLDDGITGSYGHPGNLAYVIYTSGTTGKPKGAMISHASVVNYIRWAAETYLKGEKLDFPLYSSISFDLTVTSLFTPLITGNAVIVHENREHILPVEKIIEKNKPGVVKLTPSHLYMIKYKPIEDSRIKCFIVGGEVLETRIAREIFDKFNGNADIYNEYGPTEATVGCLIYKFNPAADTSHGVPIGAPINGTRVYILDRNQKPVPVGVSGEIYVSGNGVARGYLNRPELTSEKFVPDPFTRGKFMYRTGDLARMLPGGNIDFLGRIDQQVKIRGHRIELAEIEQQLSQHEDVIESVVIARDPGEKSSENEKQDHYLCAYFTADTELQIPNLRDYLSHHLPDYMVPLYFVQLEEIPLTVNGKIDRKALPVPGFKKETDYVAPRDEIEEKLVNIWSDVLRIDGEIIGIDSSFFELGGQSLKQVYLISQVHKELNVKVPPAEIFKRQTIRELSEYIKGAEVEEYVSIIPVEKKEYYTLSSSQKRVYIVHLMEFEKTLYNVPILVTKNREIDKERFERAFHQLIRRQESFRTSFIMIDGTPVQKIEEQVDFKIEYYDLENELKPGIPSDGNPAREIIHRFVRPFDLSRAPLLRIGLIKLAREKYIMMIDMHHIINDGISVEIMVREFNTLYEGGSLPELRVLYKDYAEWRNSEILRLELEKQEQYWIEQFKDDIPVLNIQTDFPRPRVQNFEGSVLSFRIGKEETGRLDRFVMQQGVTFFIVMIAAFNILLSKLSSREDILIGTVLAGRKHADLEKIIGIFINTIVLRNYPQGEKTFIEFLNDVKNTTLGAFDNQDYQFEDLLENVNVRRDLSRNPMFDVMMNWMELYKETGDTGTGSAPDSTAGGDSYKYNRHVSKFDMSWYGAVQKGEISFSVEYCTKLYKKETILRFFDYFKRIISHILESPGLKISQIDIIPPEEKERLLVEFNQTRREYPSNKTIHQLFEEQVEKTPDHTAAAGPCIVVKPFPSSAGKKTLPLPYLQLTYRQLNRGANRLARLLREKGVRPGTVVGVMPERSVELILAIMAVLKAGGTYLPLDPGYPGERVRYILEDSVSKLLLTRESIGNAFKDLCQLIDLEKENLQGHGSGNLEPLSTAKDTAYAIYTSGSTGKPKGVMIENRPVVNFIEGIADIVPFTETGRMYSLTTVSFDIFVLETLLPLTKGTQVVLGTREEQLDAAAAASVIRKEKITLFQLTPSALRLLLSNVAAAESLKMLDYLLVGGEAFPAALLEKAQAVVQGKILNLYGPTETTVWSAVRDVTHQQYIDIGKPIANTSVYILGRGGEVRPLGVPGELCIAGDGVARGYVNLPEATSEKFVRNPLVKGQQLYRTGDLARWMPDGNIEFLGRMDFQVKIRGFRIEVGEIESQLVNHKDIGAAVVLVKTSENNEKYLSAYIAPADTGVEFTAAQVRKHLMEKLPFYMVPAQFVRLDKLPLTPNLKVDRKALMNMEGTGLTTGSTHVPPKSEQEKKIADTWKEFLQVDNIGVHDNFFEVGGSSIHIIRVTNRLNEIFDRDIPITTIFEYSTIRLLAQYLTPDEPGSGNEGLPNEKRDRSGELENGKSRLLQRMQRRTASRTSA